MRSGIVAEACDTCRTCHGWVKTHIPNGVVYPLNGACRCARGSAVTLVPSCKYAITLMYSVGFQSASIEDKEIMCSALGFRLHDNIVCCGQPGPLFVKTIGRNLEHRRDLYVSFLVNGFSHLVFNHNSLCDFFLMCPHINILSRPERGAPLYHAYELMVSVMRLPTPHRIYKVLLGKNEYDPMDVTVYRIMGIVRTHDHEIDEFPCGSESNTEVLEARWWGSEPEKSTIPDQIAKVDKMLAQKVTEVVTDETIWHPICSALAKVFPYFQGRILSHAAKESLVHVLLYYTCDQTSSVSFHFASMYYKTRMTLDEIKILDILHVFLFISHELVSLWKRIRDSPPSKRKNIVPNYEMLESAITSTGFFRFTLPWW